MTKFIVLACIATMLGACESKKEEEKTAEVQKENAVALTDAQQKNADIKIGKIEQRSISAVLKVNGSIDVPPQNMVSISVPLGGYLKSSKLLPGMHVKKGESIAIMEDQQYITLQQEYLTAKAKLVFAESEFKRQ